MDLFKEFYGSVIISCCLNLMRLDIILTDGVLHYDC